MKKSLKIVGLMALSISLIGLSSCSKNDDERNQTEYDSNGNRKAPCAGPRH